MNEYEKKYIGEILKAVNVHATHKITDKLRQIVNKIHKEGYDDGLEERDTYCEDNREPYVDFSDLD